MAWKVWKHIPGFTGNASNPNQLSQQQTELLQKGEIRVFKSQNIASMSNYKLIVFHLLSYVDISDTNKIVKLTEVEMKNVLQNFVGHHSVKFTREIFQSPETHFFQAALRTPWLKKYDPFYFPITKILLYSIKESAHASIIECIINTYKDEIDWAVIDELGNTIFHVALLQNDLNDQVLMQLIRTNEIHIKELIHHLNNNNESLISIAFKRQSNDSQFIIKMILDAGATLFIQRGDIMHLPDIKISLCFHANHVSVIVNKILEEGQVISQLNDPLNIDFTTTMMQHYFKPYELTKNEHLKSLLEILKFPCPNLLKVLLKEKLLILNEKTASGSSILHLAAMFGHTSILIEILSKTNLKLDQRETDTENNALHKAVLGEKCDNLKILLMHNDSKIITCLNTKNSQHQTPLELAIRNCFYPGILTFFENNSRVLSEHWLPNIIIAIKNHKSDLLKVLLSFFSCPLSENSFLCEKSDPEGYSILHIAVLYFNEQIFELILQKYLEFDISTNKGAKLIDCKVENSLDSDLPGYTPLILSLKKQQFSATEKLLKAGASNLLGGYPCYFHYLVECCRDETVLDQLLKVELNPSQFPTDKENLIQVWQVLDCGNNTLLHYSLKCKNHIAVKLLAQLTPFCDYSKLDVEGNSILHTEARLDSSNELTSEFIIGLRKHKLDVSYTKLIDLQECTNGYSALMLAVKNANSKMFNFLMEEKASLLLFDNNRNSILHIIVELGKVEFFDIIMNTIDNSKCTNIHRLFHTPNDEGISPIEKAVLKARVGIIRSFRQIHNINFTNSKTGLSLLHLAVIIKSIDSATRKELINELLNKTSLLESKDKNGQTPTFLAVSSQNVDSLEILLKFNPNISVIDKEGFTLLQRAIEQYNKVIFGLLILYIESRQDFLEVIHFQGNNGKDALCNSIETANYEATEKLLSLKPPLSTNDNEGNTYIHIACKFPESVNILKLLIEHYQKRVNLNLITQQNLNMFTPLLYAIYHRNNNACQVLLSHNANLFYFDMDGVQQFHSKIESSKLTFCEYSKMYYVGYSFSESQKLHWVLSFLNKLSEIRIISNTTVQSIKRINNTLVDATITQPSSQLLKMLLIQIRPFPQDFNPIYDLYIPAAKKGSMPVIMYLINEHIRPEDYLNTTKSSILYESTNNHDDDVLLQFCRKVSDLPNTDFKRIGEILITDQTTHPLIHCLNLKKTRIFSYLLIEKFQIPLTFADQQGNTIIHKILSNDIRKEFLTIFVNQVKERETSLFIDGIPLVDCFIYDSKLSPLHICAQRYTDCLTMILELTPDPTSRDKFGNTALHLAVKAKSLERTRKIAETFEKTDKVINAVNSKQHTPLHIAVIDVCEEIVKALLGYRANIYSIDAEKKTVLHHSVLIQNRNKSLSMVKIFLEYEKESPQPGNNLLSQSDNQGMTALHIAIKCSNIKVTEYLLEQQPDLSSTDHHHNTVFHLAVEQKSSAIINSLLRANGLMDNTITSSSYDFFNMRNSDGNTALSLAIRTGNENNTNLILGIQPRLDISDNEGNSTLHLAVQSQSENILRDLLRVMKSMNPEGIQHYLNAINNDGLSPLHYAITLNNHIAARILCDDGAQLAINLPNGTLTLCNGISGLRLRIFSERTLGMWNTVTTFFGAEGCKYFVCYTFGDKIHTYAISCLLPELKTTQFTDSDKLFEMDNISEGALQILTQCKSIEPLATAINNKSIDFSKNCSIKLLYDVLGTASIQIMDYLYTYYPNHMNTTGSLKGLKVAVGITNNSDKIKDCLKRLPPLDDIHSPQPNKNIDLQEVNNIIQESLRISLSNDSIANLKTLLDHNLRINYLYGDKDDHTTLLHIVILERSGLEFLSFILKEIEKRESTIPKSTFINGTPLIECKNQDGKTVLHLCIENGNKAMLEKLFYCIPDMDKKDNSLNTIVHLVAKFCDDSMAEFLFNKIHPDEYPYFFQSVNTEGCSPLHLAVGAGKEHMCSELLIRGTPLYSIDYQQQTVIHYSLKVENKALRLATLSLLLTEHIVKKGMKDFLKIQDKDGRTALHVAVYLQYEEEIDLLIQADPSVIEVCDKSLQTPLHLAINPVLSIPNEKIFEKVFAILKTDPLDMDRQHIEGGVICQQDLDGRTALHLAVQNHFQFALEVILPTQPCLDLQDNEGNTIFHEAVKYPCDNHALYILIKHIKVNFPQEMPYYLELKNSQGIPPLHYAIVNKHLKAAKLLTEGKASLYLRNPSGRITLCDNIEGLQLSFLLDCKTSKSVIGRTYYIGYLIQEDNQSMWIMSDLPELSSTIFTGPQSNMENIVTKTEFERESLLDVILRCHSSEPLASAFRRNFLDPFQVIKGKHLSQIVGMNATPEVMCYYLTQFNGTVYQHMGNCPCILESAVSNPDINTLCIVLKALPKELIQKSKIDKQLSQCIQRSLDRSLDEKDTKALDQLLTYHPSYMLTCTYGKDRSSLLHIVVNEGKKVECAESILKVACEIQLVIKSKENVGFQLINFPDATQRTVLHHSILNDREDVLTVLLSYHPDLGFLDFQNDTPLHLAVNCCRKQSLVRTLLTAINCCQNPTYYLEARNKNGLTPLLLAVTKSNPQIIQEFLNHKADFYARDSNNSTILHRVLEMQTPTLRKAMISTILEYEKNTLKLEKHSITSQQDIFELTPLHIAVKKAQFEIVKVLISADPRVLSICDNKLQTVLHLAILSQQEDIFNFILKYIQDELLKSTCIFNGHILCFQDIHGKTPLHLSIECQNINAFNKLLSNSCLDLADNTRDTVLHTAVRLSDTNCVIIKNLIPKLKECLLEEHFYKLNIEGYPPLQLAIELERYQAAIELVKQSVGLCFQDGNNEALACKHSKLNLQLLYEKQETSVKNPENFWIGYSVNIGRRQSWIAAHLPDLEPTKYFEHDRDMQVSEQMNNNLLGAILKCHSSDPFNSAIKSGLINEHMVRKIGKHSTREVIEYFIGWSRYKIYERISDQLSLLESAVANQDISVLSFLLEMLSGQSLIPPSEGTKDKEMITLCLKNSLKLSLRNNTVDALNELLKYKAGIDHTYDNGDSLLHLIINEKRDSNFIESLMLYAERTTQIPKVKFIDVQNECKMTALHLAIKTKKVPFIKTLLLYKPSLLIHGPEGNTPLHLAIKLSIQFDILEEMVKYCLKRREIINAVNDKSCTPLHFAVDSGECNLTQLLLNSNADIYSQDMEKSTALHHAVKIIDQGKTISIIDLLKKFESKNFSSCKLNSIRDSNGQTPLHLAVIRNEVDVFNTIFANMKLFEEWPNSIIPSNNSIANSQDKEGKTPLLLSIEHKNTHAFKELMDAQSILTTVDQLSDTVLHYAVRINYPEIFLKSLIPRVNDSMLVQQNDNDLPPLQYAIKQGNYTAVSALINAGVSLSFKGRNKDVTLCHTKDEMFLGIFKYKEMSFKLWTGFHFKFEQSSYFVLSELPDLSITIIRCNSKVAIPTNLKNKYLKEIALCHCQEPLIAAFNSFELNLKNKLRDGSDITETVAKYAPPNSIECILKKDSSTLIKGRDGHLSMVESAVSNPNLESLDFLLSSIPYYYSKQKVKQSDFNEARSKCLKNSLVLSLSNDNPNALAILLKYQTLLNLFYEGNDTLLHLIVKKDKSTEFINSVFCFLNKAKFPEKSTNSEIYHFIDLQNDCKQLTALHVSIEKGQEENVKTLLKHLPDISLQDSLGNTSLHFAAKQRKVIFVNYIIEATRDSSLQDLLITTNLKQETPLHVSIISGNKDVAEILLRSGSNYTMKSSDGYCILHHAVEFKDKAERITIIEFILDYEKAFSKTNHSLTTNQDDIGFTPLILAIQMEHLDAVEKLISYDQTFRISDNAGLTPLHYAVLSRDNDTFDTVLKAIKEKEDLISNLRIAGNATTLDTDLLDYRLVCSRDNKGKTPLHLSIEKHKSNALEKLLHCKPCLDTVDSDGHTLLHCGVKFDFVDGLRTVLTELKLRFKDNYSYFVNLPNASKLPPLHYAIKESRVECIKVLLEHEVTLTFADACGELILADNLDGLSLSFVDYQHNNIQYWTGYSFVFEQKLFWVISSLPNMEESILVSDSTNIKRFSCLNLNCLQAISQSRSFEPLNAAIRTKTLTLDKTLGDTLPMKLISQYGTRQSLRCLLKYMRPNLFTRLNGIDSIIECAIHNTDEDAFEFLLENLPKFCDEPIPLSDGIENISENSMICLCFKRSLELSISNTKPSTLISLLNYFPKLNYRYGEKNNTLMHLMINNEKSSEFIQRVFTLIKEHHLEIIKPENSPVIDLQNSIGQTMIHLCIQKKQWENFNVLINNFPNLQIKDDNEDNSLHYAVRTQNQIYVEKILETVDNKCLLLSARNTSDFNPLHLAIKQGNNDIAEFLLKSKSTFYPEKENEPTILHLAVGIVDSESRVSLMKTIFIHEPQLHSGTRRITCFKDGDGYSPLHLAVVKRYPNAVDHLLQIDLSPLLIRDKNKQTPLHLAIIPQSMGGKYPNFTIEDHSIFSNVLRACINLHGEHKDIHVCGAKHLICIQDSRKRTAVHYALEHMNIHAFKQLLETRSCLDIPDENGYISTHQAVENPSDITCLVMLTDELERRYGDSIYAPFKFDYD